MFIDSFQITHKNMDKGKHDGYLKGTEAKTLRRTGGMMEREQ